MCNLTIWMGDVLSDFVDDVDDASANEKTPQFSLRGFLFGGESGIRTPDLRIMIPSL